MTENTILAIIVSIVSLAGYATTFSAGKSSGYRKGYDTGYGIGYRHGFGAGETHATPEPIVTGDTSDGYHTFIWKQGKSIGYIAGTLHINQVRLASITCRYRHLFPYRRGPYEKED